MVTTVPPSQMGKPSTFATSATRARSNGQNAAGLVGYGYDKAPRISDTRFYLVPWVYDILLASHHWNRKTAAARWSGLNSEDIRKVCLHLTYERRWKQEEARSDCLSK